MEEKLRQMVDDATHGLYPRDIKVLLTLIRSAQIGQVYPRSGTTREHLAELERKFEWLEGQLKGDTNG